MNTMRSINRYVKQRVASMKAVRGLNYENVMLKGEKPIFESDMVMDYQNVKMKIGKSTVKLKFNTTKEAGQFYSTTRNIVRLLNDNGDVRRDNLMKVKAGNYSNEVLLSDILIRKSKFIIHQMRKGFIYLKFDKLGNIKIEYGIEPRTYKNVTFI